MEEEIRKAYDAAVVAIQAMSKDIAEMETKYGATSPIIAKRRSQLQAVVNFYNVNKAYIEQLRELSMLMATNYKAMELVNMQRETSLPWDVVGRLSGIDGLQKLASLDEKLNVIYKSIKSSL